MKSVSVILTKELPVSTVHRLAIEYRDRADDADRPRTLFLKRGGASAGLEMANIARSEVEFYNDLAPGIGCPPLIRWYDAAFDEETGQSHVLMEDLTETHTQPEEHTAPSKDLSRLAVETLARVHAPWWSRAISDVRSDSDYDPALLKAWQRFDEAWLSIFVENLTKDVAEFLEVAGDVMTSKQKDAYRQMLTAAPRIWGRLLDTNGLTVTHGDLHWWNFLYPKDPATDSVRAFDWQLWHIDLGARDLAFLLALGGFAEPRPAIESSLLRSYHDALGVEVYSWEMLNHDYRMSAIRNLNIPVIFWKQGKHESTWKDALRRAFESYERLRCGELLG